MKEILSDDYEEYLLNCKKHHTIPICYTDWIMRAQRINYMIAELMEALE